MPIIQTYRKDGKEQGDPPVLFFFLKLEVRGCFFPIPIFLLFFLPSLNAQNIVPNGSFEEIHGCDSNFSWGCCSLDSVKKWFYPTNEDSECFHALCQDGGVPQSLIGKQQPKSGNAYGGLITFWDSSSSTLAGKRDYMEVRFEQALKKKNYCLSFFISLADSSKFASGEFGILFSEDLISSNTDQNLNYDPQKEFFPTPLLNDSSWVFASDTFQASGGERFLTLGNFNADPFTPSTDSATPPPWLNGNDPNVHNGIAHYYIDDVSVIPVEPVRLAGDGDTSIYRGDSVRLSRVEDTITDYSWSPEADLSDPDAAGPWASPEETTTYTVTKRTHCDTTTAQVTVRVEEPPPPLEERLYIPNAFSPNQQGPEANESFRVFFEGSFREFHLQVYSRWGELVFESRDPNEGWDGTFGGEELPPGVFAYRFEGILGNGERVERRGTVTLLK